MISNDALDNAIRYYLVSNASNALAPGISKGDSKIVIFNLVLLIGIFRSHDNALRWMPQNLTDESQHWFR